MTDNEVARRCAATNKDGTPCQSKPSESGLCTFHDPRFKERVYVGRGDGSRNRAKTIPVPSAEDVASLVGETLTLEDIRIQQDAIRRLQVEGKISPQLATSLLLSTNSVRETLKTKRDFGDDQEKDTYTVSWDFGAEEIPE